MHVCVQCAVIIKKERGQQMWIFFQIFSLLGTTLDIGNDLMVFCNSKAMHTNNEYLLTKMIILTCNRVCKKNVGVNNGDVLCAPFYSTSSPKTWFLLCTFHYGFLTSGLVHTQMFHGCAQIRGKIKVSKELIWKYPGFPCSFPIPK